MWPRHLAPKHPYLRPPNLPFPVVHVRDLLAQVEGRGFGVVDAFDFDEGGVGVGVALAALVGEVSALWFGEEGVSGSCLTFWGVRGRLGFGGGPECTLT